MSAPQFRTQEGKLVPAVTAEQMREVDRIAIDDFGLDILQMMENAGRSLAANAIDLLEGAGGEVTILSGAGGNGGGGLCCARHLHNRGHRVNLVFDRSVSELRGAAVILDGYTAEAGLAREAAAMETLTAEADQAGTDFVANVSTELESLLARLAQRHTGWFTRWRYELGLGAMLHGCSTASGGTFSTTRG